MADPILAENILIALTSKINQTDSNRLEILCTDFIANAILGERKYNSPENSILDGISERAVRLGLYASALDMDDIDWRVVTHPGSVVWPVAVAIGTHLHTPLEQVLTNAAYGYRTGATIAHLFGVSHRSKWHSTSTSGAFAATSTAAMALNLTVQQHLHALHICGANIGGSPQAGFERLGAVQANRAAAITLGITSAHAALIGAPNVNEIWDGPRGLLEMFAVEAESSEILDGVSTAELRLLPTNGFTHSAVMAAWELYLRTTVPVAAIQVILPASSKSLLDGSRGGSWWDPAFAVAALWNSGDPMNLSAPNHFLTMTTVEFADLPIGAARVRIETEIGSDESYFEHAREEIAWINKKNNDAGIRNAQEGYRRCSNFPLAALR